MDIIESGLKVDLARAIAGRNFATYQDYIRALISTNEALQQLCTKDQKKSFGSGNSVASGSGSAKLDNKDKPCVDNSKYKLTDKEKKEHMDRHLWFKCHKPSHSSKDCKNP